MNYGLFVELETHLGIFEDQEEMVASAFYCSPVTLGGHNGLRPVVGTGSIYLRYILMIRFDRIISIVIIKAIKPRTGSLDPFRRR